MKLNAPASKPKKIPRPSPADDAHDLPPINRRVKNRPRKKPKKRVVIHRAQDEAQDNPTDGSELAAPYYSQLPGLRHAREID